MSEKIKPWWKNATIRGITFNTRKELEAHIRGIVNRAEIDVALSDEDYDFMMDVLSHHPEFWEKAQGAYDIVVRVNRGDHFTTKGFWFLKTDKPAVDISWPVALDAKHRSYGRMLREAARHAVAKQIQQFRDGGGRVCAICGAHVGRDDTHVDHAAPYWFERLVTMWFGEGVSDVALTDTGLHAVFTDPGESARWQEFHEMFAVLRVTHSACNLSQAKGSSK